VTKNRLELFSDGVFAIVLTLLALDLRAPRTHGLGGLTEVAPALGVHAASFFVVGVLWLQHHGALARVLDIKFRTLLLNLLFLFWITLIPFGARVAAERPLEPLGPSLISGITGLAFLALLLTRLTAHSALDDNPRLARWRRGRIVMLSALILMDLVCAAGAWVLPWIGYAAAISSMAWALALPTPPEVEQRLGSVPKQAEPVAAEEV
jgi:uncharacterized membrane protein